MIWRDKSFITLGDLYLAYRKAKFDIHYERQQVVALGFAKFETNLRSNLQKLLSALNASAPKWNVMNDFVGSYDHIPKTLRENSQPIWLGSPNAPQLVISDPDLRWRTLFEEGDNRPADDIEKPDATFRVVGRHSVEMHIISALWIQKVGYKYDQLLGRSAYGARLLHPLLGGTATQAPDPTHLATFQSYSRAYSRWRSAGLHAMQKALDDQRTIVTVTADLRSFYHELNPLFLLQSDYLKRTGLRLSQDEIRFTDQLLSAIRHWARLLPTSAEEAPLGVPVGLAASRVIANAALWEFDRFVERELTPIYYGRYVDDVLLVLDNPRQLKSAEDVWAYIVEKSQGLLQHRFDREADEYWLTSEYLLDSRLRFGGHKQRVFILSGDSGQSLLGHIERTIKEHSSEWRLLPDLPDDPHKLAADFISATRDATEQADSLGKSDGISIKRLEFALRLRNFESIARNLAPEQWQHQRSHFFKLVEHSVLTANGVFDYAPYIPRVVGLAVACGDWPAARLLIRRLKVVFALLEQTTQFDRKDFDSCRRFFLVQCLEAAARAIPPSEIKSDRKDPQILLFLKEIDEDSAPASIFALRHFANEGMESTPQTWREMAKRLYISDLSREPYRLRWLENAGDTSLPEADSHQTEQTPDAVSLALRVGDLRSFFEETGLAERGKLATPVLFPTRPFQISEITLVDQMSLQDSQRLNRWIRAFHGSSSGQELDELAPSEQSALSSEGVIVVPTHDSGDPLIALPCLRTEYASWTAAVVDKPDPDATRYFRVYRLINDILRGPTRVQYVVLPELALPRRWFSDLAHRLALNGISLIAGLEYFHWGQSAKSGSPDSSKPFVTNEVRASLVTKSTGYNRHVTYVQEKWRAALEEGRLLLQIGGKQLKPQKPQNNRIVRHGNFHFGILICSELTNLSFRERFRGNVDALLVPEWNQDITTFGALVEASALDIHCYVVQVNNRLYGDCRVRAPFREDYKRDVARVKGSEHDYFVIARIEASKLRAFQSHHSSPENGEFKPVPDGFEIAPARVVQPR